MNKASESNAVDNVFAFINAIVDYYRKFRELPNMEEVFKIYINQVVLQYRKYMNLKWTEKELIFF